MDPMVRHRTLAVLVAFSLIVLSTGTAHGQDDRCGIPAPPGFIRLQDYFIFCPPDQHWTIILPVAVHLIHSGEQVDFPVDTVETLIDHMGWTYTGTSFQFRLVRVDRTNNKEWYENCGSPDNESAMKSKLAYFPADVLNLYVCYGASGRLGRYTHPFGPFPGIRSDPEDPVMQGIILPPSAMPSSRSHSAYDFGFAAHDASRWLSLFYTYHPGDPGQRFTRGLINQALDAMAGYHYNSAWFAKKDPAE